MIPTRVFPATREALMMFTMKDLKSYAKGLGVTPRAGITKDGLVKSMLATGKATCCGSLGN